MGKGKGVYGEGFIIILGVGGQKEQLVLHFIPRYDIFFYLIRWNGDRLNLKIARLRS